MAETAASNTDLQGLVAQVRSCRRCDLGELRTNVVAGDGSASARLMLVGEAPGYHEDREGKPFVGRAGKLLSGLLARIGLEREEVYITNVLKCRPPDNRDPLPDEVSACRGWLERQVEIIEPAVICSLGNFATRLLSGKNDGITRVHGAPQEMPGGRALLFPVFHPAAALYTPANLEVLEHDFDRLAKLLETRDTKETGPADGDEEGVQLGLF